MSRAVRVEVAEGRLAAAFDLVVVGTNQRRGPWRWWLGSVAEAVVLHSACPVLVVPAGAVAPDRRRAPAILACVRPVLFVPSAEGTLERSSS